jgi:CPA1 family monovalent cation:H+ antiporter
MPDAEIFIGLLLAISFLVELSRPLGIPYPVLLVVGGLLLGFVPGLPAPTLDPGTFFFFFLPPLVYSEAFRFSTEELRSVAGEVMLLAVGLVLATAACVALAAHELLDITWSAAFVLGAVVGPTDPVSATAIIRRVGVSPRVATILEGEALVNDGSALVVYKLAVAAAVSGTFSVASALPKAAWVIAGGIAIGVAVPALWSLLRRRFAEPETQVALSLVMPFAAYFPAERLGVSGVLAAVTTGLLLGRRAHVTAPGTRLRRHAFWEVLVFLLNSALFLLVGLTFPDVLRRLGETASLDLVWHAVALAVIVVGLRLLWMFLLPRLVAVLEPCRSGRPSAGELLVLGWSGMRGGVSLAAALAVPLSVSGHPFPGRDEIIFLAYMVLLATLVLPGLTLGPLIRRLGIGSGRPAAPSDARAHLLRAAVEHLDELARNDELPDEIADMLRTLLADLESDGRITEEEARLLEQELELEEPVSG